jgi:hypothetical protein
VPANRGIIPMNRFATIFFAMLIAVSMHGQSPANSAEAQPSGPDYSGMYSFLQEGEFLQITVEDHGEVTGFVSRYSSGQGAERMFVDHFLKQGRIAGGKISFATEVVQNVAYEFKGSIERGDGKNLSDEGYYLLKGKLTQNTSDTNHQTISKSQPVTFKSFPQDVDEPK